MRRRYDKAGLLAVNPQAFFGFFFEEPERTNTSEGAVTIVDIRGPLDHHAGWWCDSYDEILERVDAACASTASAIVLRLDSPGGDASGCLETARAIRAKCAAAGKRLVAYVEGQACSAAYALACAASEIVGAETSILGSIGVLNARFDSSEADKMYGYRIAFTTSGARKADGHPSNPVSEAELVATQKLVDSLAGSFFELVEDLRGIPAAKVQALDAGIFHGAQAVEVGLADTVEPFGALLARLAGAESEEQSMTSKYDEGRAALEEAAKGDGEEAEKARKALKAMDEEPAAESDDGDDKEKDPPEESAEGEGDEPAAEDPKEDDDPPASSARGAAGTVSARTAGAVGAAANTLAARVERLEREREATARAALLASRPDLSGALRKVLATKPLADVREMLAAMPKPKAPKLGALAAPATPAATRGATQGTAPAATVEPDPELARVDAAMGFGPKAPPKAEMRGNTLYLGRAPTPDPRA